jgi:HEAT repeat protein
MKDQEPVVRVYAALALWRIDSRQPEPVRVLVEVWTGKPSQAQYLAAEVLGLMGPAAKAAIPALVKSVKTEDEDETGIVRSSAAEALGRIGAGTTEVVPTLMAALKDRRLRWAAAEALGRLGATAKVAVPALVKLMEDSNGRVQAALALWRIQQRPEAIAALVAALKEDKSTFPARALGEIGSGAKAAVPALRQALKQKNAALRAAAAQALWRISRDRQVIEVLLDVLGHWDGGAQQTAIRTLGEIGPAAKAALPLLLPRMKDEDRRTRHLVAEALEKIEPGVLRRSAAAWARDLQKADTAVRRNAALALGTLFEEEETPALVGALKDTEAVVRHEAAFALVARQQHLRSAGAVLTAALKDTRVRGRALKALRQVGSEGAAAVPALADVLGEAGGRDRRDAAALLGTFGPKALPAVLALVETLQDRDARTRATAADALGAIGPKAKDAVPALLGLLRDEEDFVRRMALRALGRLGPEAQATLPALKTALKDRSTSTALVAALALWRVDRGNKAALAMLSQGMNSDDCQLAADALVKIGPEAVPVLLNAFKSKRPLARAHAADALARIGPRARAAVPALTEALKDPDTCTEATVALGHLGAAAREAVPALRRVLKVPEGRNRVAAAVALWRIEGRGETAFPILKAALKDTDEFVRGGAAEAVAEVGPGATWGVPALIEALKDPNPYVRDCAALALYRLGPSAKAAVPALLRRLSEPDKPGVKRSGAVEEALKGLDPEAAAKAGLRPRNRQR